MKNSIILLIALFLAFSPGFAQETINSKINIISDLDKKIYRIKHIDVKILRDNLVNTLRNSPELDEYNKDTLVLRLYSLLELENPAINPDTLLFYLENIRTYEAVFELYNKLNTKILRIEEAIWEPEKYTNDTYLGGLKRNLKVLENHMNYILDYYYCQYKNTNSSHQAIKGVFIEIDNDLFAYNNQDMNYTGGGRFELTTDYLKMQLLPFLNKEKILSYQGIFVGFKAFTPFIRDTSIFKTETSYDVEDRPFASYSFIGRSKYRIHSYGHMRLRSEFKAGVIGGNIGNIVQSIIHRDQFVTSLKPYGWESQIANGGRFAWNMDQYFDLMLFSGNGDIFNLNRERNTWLNIPVMVDLHLGNELTSFGGGIGFSNLSFKDRSGNEDIRSSKSKKVRLNLSINAKYSYVMHNSMLEGIGIFETFPDDDDPLAPKDIYRLEANEVVRHLFLAELFIGIQTMRATVYWKLTINTEEYNKPKAREIYQWGRFGLNFLL